MKTQLLEDIGQSATLSLVPSGRVSNAKSPPEVQDQARVATPVAPRSAAGVWRQKPAGEPPVVATPQPHQPPPPPAEPAPAANPMPKEPAPQGPVFDFTLPSPTTPSPDLFIHEPNWFERSGKSYLLWGLFVLSGALIFQGGSWLYGQRKDANALAVVADKSKAEPQFDKAVKPRPIAAKEFTLGADGNVQATPPAPAVPPLVLLEPAPPTAAKVEPAAEQAPPAAPPRRVRPPERQLAREPVMQAEKKPGPDATMAATLKACTEHGYSAAQCVKRKCSVTKYGFVCRGT